MCEINDEGMKSHKSMVTDNGVPSQIKKSTTCTPKVMLMRVVRVVKVRLPQP